MSAHFVCQMQRKHFHVAGESDEFKQIKALLEPISKVCLERLSETRCASDISRDDLQSVRDAMRTLLQEKEPDLNIFTKPEEYW